MRVSIYQIQPELDTEGRLFRGMEHAGGTDGRKVQEGIYACVYDGELEAADPEQVFAIFNTRHPKRYSGRSVSVSDIVGMRDGNGSERFYFCCTFRFVPVDFDKSRSADRKEAGHGRKQ